MKALTIQQPWAALIAAGEKRIENRTWSTKHRGQIAIHAGVVDDEEPVAVRLSGHPMLPPGPLPHGAIVAVVELADCIHVDHIFSEDYRRWWDSIHFATGPYCWLLKNIWPALKPIPCRGQLGLWDVPAPIEEQIAPCLIV